MNGIGIVCALPAEARHFGCNPKSTGTIHALRGGSFLALSGLGIRSAAYAAEDLRRAHVQALVSWGLAGGLDPALTAGTVCLPSVVLASDGSTVPTASDWIDAVVRTLGKHRVVHGGRLLSVSRPVATPESKAQLFRSTRAQAVDMESIGIARVAAATGLPFLVLRVITDTADDLLPTAVLSAMQEKELRYGRVLGATLGAPHEIPAVVRLARRYRAAHRTLRDLAVCLELAQ